MAGSEMHPCDPTHTLPPNSGPLPQGGSSHECVKTYVSFSCLFLLLSYTMQWQPTAEGHLLQKHQGPSLDMKEEEEKKKNKEKKSLHLLAFCKESPRLYTLGFPVGPAVKIKV